MAFREMEVADAKGDTHIFAYETEDTLTLNSNGDWVLTPNTPMGVTFTVSFDDGVGGGPGSGSAEGKIQVVTEKVRTIKDDSSEIVPVDWAPGNRTNQLTVQDHSRPISAFRIVKTGGTGRVRMTARSQ